MGSDGRRRARMGSAEETDSRGRNGRRELRCESVEVDGGVDDLAEDARRRKRASDALISGDTDKYRSLVASMTRPAMAKRKKCR
jgi:hypothetical protein